MFNLNKNKLKMNGNANDVKDGEIDSKFILSDLTSIMNPSSLFQGDGNMFLNVVIVLIASTGVFLSKKEPADSMKILMFTMGLIYFIYASYMISPIKSSTSEKERKKDEGIMKEDDFVNLFFNKDK